MIYDGFSAKARADRASITYAFPTQGYVVWMDNVVLLNDAPNPENIAAVSNYARYGLGVTGASEFLDPELATLPESNPRATAGSGAFIAVCDEATQAVYDQI